MVRKIIEQGQTSLGIEFGSTRIKGVLIDQNGSVLATGSHTWENRLEDGIWTYSLEDIQTGLRECYRSVKECVKQKYGLTLTRIGSIGISAMQHGYMVFDKEKKLLVPFRTWRNTMTEEACEILMEKFRYPIPQRWSIAHLYQAILNQEPHVKDIDYLITLAGYVHWILTDRRAVGLNEASGMFPVNGKTQEFDRRMLDIFAQMTEEYGFAWKLEDILPEILPAGKAAGCLTEKGARLLDDEGDLQPGILLCPCEGDGGTGMVATNSIKPRTGNISAGTSVFAMLVLDKPIAGVYGEIDEVVTSDGHPVAMVHCNNCTSDLNAWIELLGEAAQDLGAKFGTDDLYRTMYVKALEGDADAGDMVSCNYLSGEHVTGFGEGRPLFARMPKSRFTLANFMKTHLYSAVAGIRIGMDILVEKEAVTVEELVGHGGLFKTEKAGQTIVADALGVPVRGYKTAEEGGAWGMALLAMYLLRQGEGMTLAEYLERCIFRTDRGTVVCPDEEGRKGFDLFLERYRQMLEIERCAVRQLR